MNQINSFSWPFDFLSSFYYAKVTYEDKVYPSIECAYQAAKFPADKRAPFEYYTSSEAKRHGREAKLDEDWDTRKLEIMAGLIKQKFAPGTALAKRLVVETGTAELIEGNWWHDTFWGVCRGVGQNHLGRLLMEQREFLRSLQ